MSGHGANEPTHLSEKKSPTDAGSKKTGTNDELA